MEGTGKLIKFKLPLLKDEFEGELSLEGYSLHPELRMIVFTLAGFADYHFRKDVTITEILRDQATQDKYYCRNPEYRVNPWKSVHQFGCGVDLRTWGFTERQLQEILDYINHSFSYDLEGSHPVALCHDIGRGKHFHLQVSPAMKR